MPKTDETAKHKGRNPEYVPWLPVGVVIIDDINFIFAYLNFLNVHYRKRDMGFFYL